MLRDPLHVLIGNGVGNSHIAALINTLRLHRPPIPLAMIQGFVAKFTLPHRLGKVDDQWLCRNRFGKKWESFSSFAGIMLTMIPIIETFLAEVVDASHPLYPHRLCFTLLSVIVGVCFLGPDDTVPYNDHLRGYITQYITLFAKLYPHSCIPKLHHLMHIPDNISFLGKLLSCFVTERKHRATKRSALFIFRHIDNTVVNDMVNRQCAAIQDNTNLLFQSKFMVAPKTCNLAGTSFRRSKEAVIGCGLLRTGDIICMSANRLGKLVWFWSYQGNAVISAHVELYEKVSMCRWSTSNPTTSIVDTDCIIDACMYCMEGDESIFVIQPFRLSLPPL